MTFPVKIILGYPRQLRHHYVTLRTFTSHGGSRGPPTCKKETGNAHGWEISSPFTWWSKFRVECHDATGRGTTIPMDDGVFFLMEK